jgi:hypothetical protein
MVIGVYFIGAYIFYCWLFWLLYSWLLMFIYWCLYILLLVIGLVAICAYLKLNYHMLLLVIGGTILLMAIGGYFIN